MVEAIRLGPRYLISTRPIPFLRLAQLDPVLVRPNWVQQINVIWFLISVEEMGEPTNSYDMNHQKDQCRISHQ